MKDELKPCPFCGQEKPSLWPAGGYWKVKCVDGCSLSITGYMNKAAAITAWNRRPAEQIQELEPRGFEKLKYQLTKLIDEAERVYLAELENGRNLNSLACAIEGAKAVTK